MNANRANAAILTFDELSRCREVFNSHADEYATNTFDLKVMLSELGQFPTEDELAAVMRIHHNKVNFNTFCKYMEYMKYKFISPEPKDIDTVRAFAALGGGIDRTGCVERDYLVDTCKHFELQIDIDQMIREVDNDSSGSITYNEFQAMWDNGIMEDEVTKMRRMSRKPSNANRGEETVSIMANPSRVEENLRSFFFPQLDKKPTSPELEVGHVVRRGSMMKSNAGGTLLAPLQATKSVRKPSMDALPDVAATKASGESRIMKGLKDSIKRVEGGGHHTTLKGKKKF
eukprot:PhF_6_TR42843/c1_g1_i1/m.64879